MFFVPLSQVESVELLIHALRMAGGEADCTSCPARRVCMKQCLTIASSIENMVQAGTLPMIGEEPEQPEQVESPTPASTPEGGGKGHLKVVK
jgi:hypothetical protein